MYLLYFIDYIYNGTNYIQLSIYIVKSNLFVEKQEVAILVDIFTFYNIYKSLHSQYISLIVSLSMILYPFTIPYKQHIDRLFIRLYLTVSSPIKL